MPDPAELAGLDPDDFWACEKHNRWCQKGYPCVLCQREWQEANPERYAAIQKLVDSILNPGRRSRGRG